MKWGKYEKSSGFFMMERWIPTKFLRKVGQYSNGNFWWIDSKKSFYFDFLWGKKRASSKIETFCEKSLLNGHPAGADEDFPAALGNFRISQDFRFQEILFAKDIVDIKRNSKNPYLSNIFVNKDRVLKKVFSFKSMIYPWENIDKYWKFRIKIIL